MATHICYDTKNKVEWHIPIEEESTNTFNMNSFLVHYLQLSPEDANNIENKLQQIKINKISDLNYLQGEDPEEIGISRDIIQKLVNYNN